MRARSTARPARSRRRILINAGCGPRGVGWLPPLFDDWRQLRVDADPQTEPDILTSVTDLSAIASACADAVWSSHCIEHLFAHEVPPAIAEFRRVLRHDGFVCVIVPDLQAIARWIADDRLQETIYQSAAGPITAHDMLWGFGPAIEHGYRTMAHHCGFTPTVLLQRLSGVGFAEVVLRRRPTLELAGVALCQPSSSPEEREALMSRLAL
jgi:SAM-dependent methyltransferase